MPGTEPNSSPTELDTASAEAARIMEEKVRKVELAISIVLRTGVVLSVLVLAAGLALMFYRHPQYASITGSFSYHLLTGPHSPFPHSFSGLGASLANGQGQGLVVVGVLLLILTPILRVAVSVLAFVYEKDPPMVIVTLFVLSVLILSFFLAHA